MVDPDRSGPDYPEMAPFDPREPEEGSIYEAIDPLDSRYRNPEVAKYLSEEARVGYQAYTEAALAHTLADFGMCERETAEEIEAACLNVAAKEVYDREYGREGYTATRHDIKALSEAVSSQVGEEAKPWVHALATSYDIVGTANALQQSEASRHVLLPRFHNLEETLLDLSERYADTPQIGRTHGQHAVPTTFGFAVSRYAGRMGESIEEMQQRTQQLPGKFSGAVGAYNSTSLMLSNPRAFEARFLERLGLDVSEHSTQIPAPEPLSRMYMELQLSAGVMAQIAEDMRHLQRSEIAEVGEAFAKGQTGSSAMPQKRNPISFENISGLHRELTGQIMPVLLNSVSEHQRDLRDSAAGRFQPMAMATVAEMARRLDSTIKKLEVNPRKLEENLAMSGGAIGSEPLQVALRRLGHLNAHTKAKEVVQGAMEQGISFRDALAADSEIQEYWPDMSEEERRMIEHPEANYLGLSAEETHRTVSYWRTRLGLQE